MKAMDRESALELLKKYNKEPFHIQHALTVEGTMRWYAEYLKIMGGIYCKILTQHGKGDNGFHGLNLLSDAAALGANNGKHQLFGHESIVYKGAHLIGGDGVYKGIAVQHNAAGKAALCQRYAHILKGAQRTEAGTIEALSVAQYLLIGEGLFHCLLQLFQNSLRLGALALGQNGCGAGNIVDLAAKVLF